MIKYIYWMFAKITAFQKNKITIKVGSVINKIVIGLMNNDR